MSEPLRIAIIGLGPTGTSLLERLLANAPEVAAGNAVEVHVIDSFPPGAGRVWRHDQSPLLWMNSMAEDVTMFPDETVRCEGPIVPGPALEEWARMVDVADLPSEAVADEVRRLDGMTFPTRQLQSAYLAWVYRRLLASTPPNVRVVEHATTALDVVDVPDGAQIVELDGEPPLAVDTVVLALGHLDVDVPPQHAADAAFAARHGLVHLAPAYTADLDLDVLPAGAPVIVRGFGLAFVDLMVLLTEGRGGRYVRDGDGLRYVPSGREPVLYVGSRRGVPYRSKIGYRLAGERAPLPRFLDRAAVAALAARDRVDFRADVWPLLVKDIAFGYYFELFHAHPARVAMRWDEFERHLGELAWESAALDHVIEAAVPDADDRFDLTRLDRPLQGWCGSLDELQEHLRTHIAADLARRRDPAFSADLGAFYALLIGFGQLAQLAGSGKLSPRSVVEDVNGWWFGFFSYFASGPPAERLEQLLALSRAGVVRALGAGMWVRGDEERRAFVAGSASVPQVVEAAALVEARLPATSVRRARSPLVQALLARGALTEQHLDDQVEGVSFATGKLAVAEDLRVLSAGGDPHPYRFAIGIHTSRPAAGTFARPRTNALSFRQNDAVARSVLHAARTRVGDRVGSKA